MLRASQVEMKFREVCWVYKAKEMLVGLQGLLLPIRIRKFVEFKSLKCILKMLMKTVLIYHRGFLLLLYLPVREYVARCKTKQKSTRNHAVSLLRIFLSFDFWALRARTIDFFASRESRQSREKRSGGDYIKKKRNGIHKWAAVHANQLKLGLGSSRGQ